MPQTKYLNVLKSDLEKNYPQPNFLWNYAENNILENDWLLITPANAFGKIYEKGEIPMPVQGDDPDFHLQPCDESSCGGRCVALQSSVKSPGQEPKKFCPGHSYMLYEKFYTMITGAEKFVDITTLTPFTGCFLAALRNALTYISKKDEGKRPIIRILYSNPLPNPFPGSVSTFIYDITRDIEKSSRVEIYAGIISSSFSSWNHAKIIAVDGTRAIVGGHNMWDKDYLQSNPVFDVSMKLSGSSVLHAHDFADGLWDYLIERNLFFNFRLNASYKFNESTRQNEIKFGVCPDKNIYKNIRKDLSKTFAGSIPILSVGRSAATDYSYLLPTVQSYLYPHDEPSDSMMVKLIGMAEKTVRMSLQSFQVTYGIVAGYNDRLFEEFGKAINRGVDIFIVLSNPKAVGGSNPYYGEGPSTINKKLLEIMTDNLKMTEIAAKNLINSHFKVASFRYSPDETYPKDSPIPNHAKTFMVDDTVFYIGSQNQYVCNLNEFGYIVEDAAKAGEYITAYWNPLWQQSQRTVSNTFSQDLADQEAAEAMEFILALDRNKRLKKVWETTLAKQREDSSPENLAKIKKELKEIILNAGFVTTLEEVESMLENPFFKDNRTENLPSQESNRFVLDLLTNKQLLSDFADVIDQPAASFEEADQKITSFLKSKGYNCNPSQVIASFNLLREHVLEYWTGIYDTWYINDGGDSFNDTSLQLKSDKANNLSDAAADVRMLDGPSLVIKGTDVTIDGVKIIDPQYNNGVLSWTMGSGNATSGHVTFNEVTRQSLNDSFVGYEFYGSLTFPESGTGFAKGKVSFFGRIHDKPAKENPDYGYLWLVLSILGSLSVLIIALRCRSALKERYEHERIGREKRRADEEAEMQPLSDADREERERLIQEEDTASSSRDGLETLETASREDYSDLVLKYHERIESIKKDLSWSLCRTSIDSKVQEMVRRECERQKDFFSKDTDTLMQEMKEKYDFGAETEEVIDHFVSSLAGEFPELDFREAQTLLRTEIVYPTNNEVVSDDSGASYLDSTLRSALLEQREHYLTENAGTIQRKIADASSVLDKTAGEISSANAELSQVKEALKAQPEDEGLKKQKQDIEQEIAELVEKQKEEESKRDQLTKERERNKRDAEDTGRDRKKTDERKSERSREIFER